MIGGVVWHLSCGKFIDMGLGLESWLVFFALVGVGFCRVICCFARPALSFFIEFCYGGSMFSEEVVSSKIKKTIEYFIKNGVENFSVNEMSASIMKASKDMVIKTIDVNKNFRVYRCRSAQSISSISEICYPPRELAPAGRANRIKSPMFYSSFGYQSAMVELGAKVGDLIFVSSWEVESPLRLAHVGFQPELYKEIGASNGDVERITSSVVYKEAVSKDIMSYLGSIFIGDGSSKGYKLSAAVAECLMMGSFDGIAYPSIAVKCQSDNLVLNPASVDSKLSLKWVEKLVVEKTNNNQVESRIVDYGKPDKDGFITWMNRGPDYLEGGKSVKWKECRGFFSREIFLSAKVRGEKVKA